MTFRRLRMNHDTSDDAPAIEDHVIVFVSDPVVLTGWREQEIGHRGTVGNSSDHSMSAMRFMRPRAFDLCRRTIGSAQVISPLIALRRLPKPLGGNCISTTCGKSRARVFASGLPLYRLTACLNSFSTALSLPVFGLHSLFLVKKGKWPATFEALRASWALIQTRLILIHSLGFAIRQTPQFPWAHSARYVHQS